MLLKIWPYVNKQFVVLQSKPRVSNILKVHVKKDNLEAMVSFDSCRDQLIKVGPVQRDLIVKVYRVLLKQC